MISYLLVAINSLLDENAWSKDVQVYINEKDDSVQKVIHSLV